MRKRLSPSLVVSLVALFVSLGGASYAAVRLPKDSVGSRQIKNGAVTSAKVRDGSLKALDFGAGQLPRGEVGPRGEKGATGKTGPRGRTGVAGPAGATAAIGNSAVIGTDLTSSPQDVLTATVSSAPAGRMVVSANLRMSRQNPGLSSGSLCQLFIDGVAASQIAAGNYDSAQQPDQWMVPVVGSLTVAAGTHVAAVRCQVQGAGATRVESGDIVAFVATK